MTSRKARVLNPVAAWMVIGVVMVVGLMAAQPAFAGEGHDPSCSVETLRGLYVFDASGYINLPSGWTPKAVVEFLQFNGDGTLTSVATASLNLAVHFGHGTGSYTVNDDCTGTLTFSPSGLHFDLFVEPRGAKFHMIQTDAGNALAGAAKRVSRDRER